MKFKKVENLSSNEYHNGEKYKWHWSSSNLKEYLVSPKEAYYQKHIAKKKETDAMVFGTQLHDFLASKHIKGQKFDYNVFYTPINNKTNKPYGKTSDKYLSAFLATYKPISEENYNTIIQIWEMICKSKYYWYFEQEILTKGIAEPSFFVEVGVHKYKYRPDVLTDKAIFDYKTINKSSFNEKGRSNRIYDYGYHISAAMYQYFEFKRTGIWKPFYIIWIMKEPPYDILIAPIELFTYEIIKNNDVIKNIGAVDFEKILEIHQTCEVCENWPDESAKHPSIEGLSLEYTQPMPYHGLKMKDIEIG